MNEGRPNVADEIVNRKVDLIVNTPLGRESFFDDRAVRRAAMMHEVPCITTLTGAAAAVSAIRAMREQGVGVRALQDYYAGIAAEQRLATAQISAHSLRTIATKDTKNTKSFRSIPSGSSCPSCLRGSDGGRRYLAPRPRVRARRRDSRRWSARRLRRSACSVLNLRSRRPAFLLLAVSGRARVLALGALRRAALAGAVGRRRRSAPAALLLAAARVAARVAAVAARRVRASWRASARRGARATGAAAGRRRGVRDRRWACCAPTRRRRDGVSLSVDVDGVGRRERPDGARSRRAIPSTAASLLTVVGALAAERMRRVARRPPRFASPAQLRRPSRYLDPGVPDQERALARRGTTLVGTVKSGALVEVVARGSPARRGGGAVRALRAPRDRARRRPLERRSRPAIVTAIVIGDRAGLDDDVERRLQEAGTYHVIAISGGNIAILAGADARRCSASPAASAARRCSRRSPALLAYGYLVGGGASVDRATLMAVVYFAGRALDLRGPPLNALALVAGAPRRGRSAVGRRSRVSPHLRRHARASSRSLPRRCRVDGALPPRGRRCAAMFVGVGRGRGCCCCRSARSSSRASRSPASC